MLKSATQSGQVAIHGIRMFLQVSKKALILAVICSILIVVGKFYLVDKIDKDAFVGTLSYSKFQVNEKINEIKNDWSNVSRKHPIIYYPKSPPFHLEQAFAQTKHWVLLDLKIAFGSLVLIYLLILFLLSKTSLKPSNKTNKQKILTAQETNKFLTKRKKLGNFKLFLEEKNWFGRNRVCYLPKDFETRHVFIAGSTGTGKTNLMHNFLPQIRSSGSSAVIMDQTGEMVQRYYSPATDLIFDPFGLSQHTPVQWDLFEEFRDKSTLDFVANTLYTPPGAEFGENASWFQNAKKLFVALVEFVLEKDMPDVELLKNLLFKAEVKELAQLMKGSLAQGILFEENMKTSTSLLSVMRGQLEWLESIKETTPTTKKFTTIEWLKKQKQSRQGGFLF